ncbi:MAG: NAD-dependent epimerase/dehydratase family protein [Candidatus Zixiibacteriota bacterium]
MRVLIIGGTRFVGRALVEALVSRNHTLTLFNRGKSNPGLFPDIEEIHGDRETDLEKLAGRKWDVAIDTCGYVPRIVRKSTDLLADKVERYLFISTLSVYADFSRPATKEDFPLAQLKNETTEEVSAKTYGGLKALCESAVLDTFAERALIVRPGYIVGPHDPTDRFTYWMWRVSQGGTMLAPEPRNMAIRFVDVRDLAEFFTQAIERISRGVYNVSGPSHDLTLENLLNLARKLTGVQTRVVWVNAKFMADSDVKFGSDFPLCSPDKEKHRGFGSVDYSKALALGLRFRPLEDTIRDTLTWATSRGDHYALKAGLSPDREKEALDKWLDRERVSS